MRSAVSLSELSKTHGIMKITVDWDEPGTIHFPWFHKRWGLTFFSTETLRPRSEPFYLFRELIRGQLSRVLKRVSEWEARGLVIPNSIRKAIHQGILRTSHLMVSDVEDPQFDEKAIEVFEMLIHLSHLLLDQFIDQSLVVRKMHTSDYPVLLGTRSTNLKDLDKFAERKPDFSGLFQAWNPGFTWRHLEPEEGNFRWDLLDKVLETAGREGLEPFIGPIVRWDRYSLPEWLLPHLDDPYTIRKSFFRYANALVDRYREVNHWVVSSGIGNEFDYLLVSKRIEWADALARTIHSLNDHANVLVGIERPWGDSLRFNSEIPPLELGERLLKNRFFNGFFLGIDLGLSPIATLPRDAFELNWLLDQWSLFGKPLYFSFSVPSSPSFNDPLWETPEENLPPWNLQTQQETVHRYFLSFLTRKTIQGIFWSRYEDIPVKKSLLAEDAKEDTKTFREMAYDLNEDEKTKTRLAGAFGGEEKKDKGDAPPSSGDSSWDVVTDGESGSGIDGDGAVGGSTDSSGKTSSKSDDAVNGPSDDDLLTNSAGIPVAEILDVEEMEIATLEDQHFVVALAFPQSGLVTTEGTPKPAFRKLAALKSAFLG